MHEEARCLERAEEYYQLAEWLKELKQYREAYQKIIKEMKSKRAIYPTPSKEHWNKEIIARNSGIGECIEIVNKYLKGGE